MINCKLCGEYIALGDLLRKEKYVPISFTRHLLEYSLKVFFEKEVFGCVPTGVFAN